MMNALIFLCLTMISRMQITMIFSLFHLIMASLLLFLQLIQMAHSTSKNICFKQERKYINANEIVTTKETHILNFIL